MTDSKSLQQLLGPRVYDNEDNPMDTKSLNGKIVGLYFSAHWCGPCRKFTPELVEIYDELKKRGKPFEIVFISSDNDLDSFEYYFSDMPWKALKFSERKKKKEITNHFQVRGIPTLILFDEEGKVITAQGRQMMGEEGAAGYPYRPDPEKDRKMLEEWKGKLTQIFQFLDVNQDQWVTKDELLQRLANSNTLPFSQLEVRANQIMKDVNTNLDSKLSLNEWLIYFEAMVPQHGLFNLDILQRSFGFVPKDDSKASQERLEKAEAERLDRPFTLIVKTLHNIDHKLQDVRLKDTVQIIKNKCETELNLPPVSRIIFQGQVLNDYKNLAFYSVNPEDFVVVMPHF